MFSKPMHFFIFFIVNKFLFKICENLGYFRYIQFSSSNFLNETILFFNFGDLFIVANVKLS